MYHTRYNHAQGWKYNFKSRKRLAADEHKGFIASLVAALVIVLVVAQILAAIDRRLAGETYSGFSFKQFVEELVLIPTSHAATVSTRMSGKILLQVEENGEGWYVNPKNKQRYYLGRPDDAFRIMREVSLGVSNKDFNSFGSYAPARLAGQILLKVEDYGKAYYVNPDSLRMHYLGRPTDAFNVMREQGVGITNSDLSSVSVAKGYDISDIRQDRIAVKKHGIFQNGVDINEYCKQNNYKVATAPSQLDEYCKQKEAERLAKIAKYADEPATPDPVVVDAPNDNTDPTTPVAPTPAAPSSTSADGPLIRVGLFYETAPQTVKASQSFTIKDSVGNDLLTVQPNQVVVIDYLEGTNRYAYGVGSASNQATSYIRLVPQSDATVFEITSYENRPGWNQSLNDNLFLGTLELRHNTSKDRTWVINELELERYLKGIAETSNSSPMEYQKALMVAARTYATYHLERATKHADEHFIVDATYDQVYKGYGAQMRLTEVTKAVDATKGTVVTYDGDVVVTPYFSWSDGHTRGFHEVWGGSLKPWLVSVKEPAGYTKTTLFGHGVGLSAHGALLLANDHNYTYDQILGYYYTGIDLTGNYNNIFN